MFKISLHKVTKEEEQKPVIVRNKKDLPINFLVFIFISMINNYHSI